MHDWISQVDWFQVAVDILFFLWGYRYGKNERR